MDMQINLLKDIVLSFIGQTAPKIVDLLYGKKNVNEFIIAKKLNLTINQTRNILYKLADEGLVSFIRKKDSKKGGWYTYFWTLNSEKGLFKFKESLLKQIENSKSQLNSKRTARFFYCPNCDIELNEENSLLHDYTCPECGEILQIKNNLTEIDNIQKEIIKAESILHKIDEEIVIIEKSATKSRSRKVKAEQRKKIKERIERKKVRDKEKNKQLNEAKKKPTKRKDNTKTKKVIKRK
mgnify:FL=1